MTEYSNSDRAPLRRHSEVRPVPRLCSHSISQTRKISGPSRRTSKSVIYRRILDSCDSLEQMMRSGLAFVRLADVARPSARNMCSHGTSSLGSWRCSLTVWKASKGRDVVTPLGWFLEFGRRCEAAVGDGGAGQDARRH